ncbi:hypothetical protein M569_05650, partial [Genlisea aurea]
MFKSARWRSDKNRIRVVFKLQFHAAKVLFGDNPLTISLVPADAGKPTSKSDAAAVREGSCLWENPVYESVKFNRDPKSGKIHEKIYYFVVGTGSSKFGVIGEASLDLSKYVEQRKVTLLSLPLKTSKSEAVLNVSIQRMPESKNQRLAEGCENGESNRKGSSLRSHLSIEDLDGAVKSNSDDASLNKAVPKTPTLNGNRRTSSGSDLTISSSGSSSGVEIPWQSNVKSESFHQGLHSDVKTPVHGGSQRSSQWEWLRNSVLEPSTDDCSSTPRTNLLMQNSDDAPDIMVEKLRSELSSLSRHLEVSELELQALRKQVAKESRRGQDLVKELVSLKEERDSFRFECEKLSEVEKRIEIGKGRSNLGFEECDFRAMVEELRQELNHEKELNSNLRIQLEKTQESNSELILAVKDLDEMLEQKNEEISNLKNGGLDATIGDNLHQVGGSMRRFTYEREDDDKEQKALDEIVKQHGDTRNAYLLEQQIIEMQSELEMSKRDKDELEMQMEQLALDYEIMKQENHEMVNKLQQSQLQEQLKIQYECSSSYAATQELESQLEKLEGKLKTQVNDTEVASERIKELEAHVKTLEDEMNNQALGFEADLEDIMRCKIEQEQRAIIAEEALKKTRWSNANTAERLQEEFRRLSVQMSSTFEANEKVVTKALTEANELRLQKTYLEEMMKKASEENESTRSQYEIRLEQLVSQVSLFMDEIKKLQSEIEEKEFQLNQQITDAEESKILLSDEISTLKKENATHLLEIRTLLEKMEVNRNSMQQLDDQKQKEITELKNKILLVKADAEESQRELNKLRSLIEEKELMVVNLRSELNSFQSQNEELKNSLFEEGLQKEWLKMQMDQLKSEVKKKDDMLITLDKKIKADAVDENVYFERIKSLEGDIKLKEAALEMSSEAFLLKEKDLLSKIEELEERVDAPRQISSHCESAVDKVANPEHDLDVTTEELKSTIHQDSKNTCRESEESRSLGDEDDEMAQLKERNTLMEAELKEMQERYSEISLKFAEVEGERQKLVMKVRNLKNSHK